MRVVDPLSVPDAEFELRVLGEAEPWRGRRRGVGADQPDDAGLDHDIE